MEKKITAILKSKGLWPLPEATVTAITAHAQAELDAALQKMITTQLVAKLLSAEPPKA